MAKKNVRNGAGAGKGTGVGSTLAITAMSAFAMGAGASDSPAQASISPQERASVVQIYKIPPGPMATALNSFADANGLHLLYDADATQRLKTPGLSGRFSAREGLDHLLAGTGLSYRIGSTGRTVSIVLAQNDTGSRTDVSGAEALPPIEVGAEQPAQTVAGGQESRGAGGGVAPKLPPAQDPYNTTYVLPDATTGTRTDTPIMETPLNVQVVTQQVIQDQQVLTLDQALKNVSGVTTGGGADSIYTTGDTFGKIYIRGFATNTIFRDGFRLYAGNASNLGDQPFANVESVEVLKGPAAILYGQVDPGGIVNITTKKPLATPKYTVDQQFGSYALYRTSVDATGPLTKDDTLLYRMNMSYENAGSFRDLVYTRNLFLAPVLKWNIDPRTQATLEFEYLDANDGGYATFVPRLASGQWLDIPRSLNYGENSPNKTKNYFVGLNWSHQFNDDWSIKQQFSSNRKTNDYANILPFMLANMGGATAVSRWAFPGFYTADNYSTNVDLTGHFETFGAKHTLLAGGDYYRFDSSMRNFYNYGSLIDLNSPVHPGTSFAPIFYPYTASKQINDNYGLYLQDQIELPNNIFVMAGARYQNIYQRSAGIGLTTGAVTANPSLRADAITPRVGLLWRPLPWLSLYGNYVEGFGPNNGLIYPGTPVAPSGARQWEGGAKVELFDGKLFATASYFDLTKTNVPTTDPNPLHIGYQIVTGEVRSKGFEFDLRGEILPGWQAIATYANTDARVAKTNNDYYWDKVGARFLDVPRNTASLWTTYQFQQASLRGLKIGGGATFRDSIPEIDSALNKFYNLPSYATIDLMTSYSFNFEGTKMTAQLNVTNLLDTKYYTAAYSDCCGSPVNGFVFGASYRTFGTPRSLLGSLKVEF